jgi:hypothetical protein
MMLHTIVATFIALFGLLLAGSGCSNVPNGDLTAVAPVSTAPRAGNVYLVRGWIGVFSTGIDTLSEKVNAAGVRGLVYQDVQWRSLAGTIAEKYKGARDPEPLILVGHSFGADDVVSIARELDRENVPVDLLVTIDPTTPPAVPKNVRLCYNLYKPGALDVLPMLRGIPLHAEPGFKGTLQNVNIRDERPDLLVGDVNHFNIEKKETIHREALRQILAVCPPRAVWASGHRIAPGSQGPIMAAHNPTPQPGPATRPSVSAKAGPSAAMTTTTSADDGGAERFRRD